jgi:mycothiol synthase
LPDVVLRRPLVGDLASARALCETVLDRDDEPGEVADLLLGGAGRSDRLALAAFAAGRLVGVAAAAVRTRSQGTLSGHLDLVAVHPSHQRSGVGRALVGHVETWTAGQGAGELWWGNDAPTYAWPGVEHGHRAAHALALAMGYSPWSEATNMTVDLAAADLATATDERRLAAAGVRVSRLTAGDLDGVLGFVRSFGGRWGEEVEHTLVHSPVGCHVARRGEQWVGFACHGTNRRGWFGPMGTAESERGQGVGAVLLRRCLADQRAAGLASAQIAWVGPVGFYARTVGAVLDRQFTLYRKDLV